MAADLAQPMCGFKNRAGWQWAGGAGHRKRSIGRIAWAHDQTRAEW